VRGSLGFVRYPGGSLFPPRRNPCSSYSWSGIEERRGDLIGIETCGAEWADRLFLTEYQIILRVEEKTSQSIHQESKVSRPGTTGGGGWDCGQLILRGTASLNRSGRKRGEKPVPVVPFFFGGVHTKKKLGGASWEYWFLLWEGHKQG